MIFGEALHPRAKETDTPLTKQGQERLWGERRLYQGRVRTRTRPCHFQNLTTEKYVLKVTVNPNWDADINLSLDKFTESGGN